MADSIDGQLYLRCRPQENRSLNDTTAMKTNLVILCVNVGLLSLLLVFKYESSKKNEVLKSIIENTANRSTLQATKPLIEKLPDLEYSFNAVSIHPSVASISAVENNLLPAEFFKSGPYEVAASKSGKLLYFSLTEGRGLYVGYSEEFFILYTLTVLNVVFASLHIFKFLSFQKREMKIGVQK